MSAQEAGRQLLRATATQQPDPPDGAVAPNAVRREMIESLKRELIDKTLTVDEMADILDFDRQTVLRYLRDSIIVGFQLGREWRVPVDELRAYFHRIMEERKEEARRTHKGSDVAGYHEQHRDDPDEWDATVETVLPRRTGMAVYSLRLPVAELAALKAHADARGLTVSDCVRRAIRTRLATSASADKGAGDMSEEREWPELYDATDRAGQALAVVASALESRGALQLYRSALEAHAYASMLRAELRAQLRALAAAQERAAAQEGAP